jgi:hypothetical protein
MVTPEEQGLIIPHQRTAEYVISPLRRGDGLTIHRWQTGLLAPKYIDTDVVTAGESFSAESFHVPHEDGVDDVYIFRSESTIIAKLGRLGLKTEYSTLRVREDEIAAGYVQVVQLDADGIELWRLPQDTPLHLIHS